MLENIIKELKRLEKSAVKADRLWELANKEERFDDADWEEGYASGLREAIRQIQNIIEGSE